MIDLTTGVLCTTRLKYSLNDARTLSVLATSQSHATNTKCNIATLWNRLKSHAAWRVHASERRPLKKAYLGDGGCARAAAGRGQGECPGTERRGRVAAGRQRQAERRRTAASERAADAA